MVGMFAKVDSSFSVLKSVEDELDDELECRLDEEKLTRVSPRS